MQQLLTVKSEERAPAQAPQVACKEWPATAMTLQQHLLQFWQLDLRAPEKMMRLAQVLVQDFVV
jgi:hypothetical protein